ncbi:hypothetical protein GCM10010446_49760 [Streptomyces enissocaesilis]|uniref:Uncharacterized protein n=1 Tax=Streptomyces enissocaesilis TaxID=332589 RepID=A0ABP6K0I6_9ACTN
MEQRTGRETLGVCEFPPVTHAPEIRMPRASFATFKGGVKVIAYAMPEIEAVAWHMGMRL